MTQGFGDRRQAIRSSDPAVTAFLYLGQKLALLPSPAPPTPGREHVIPEEASQVLLRAIEGDIIPRLLLAHRTREASAIEVPASAAALGEPDRARFLELVLNDTAASTRGFVAELLSRGVPEETIFLDLLATAARRLGELWEEDRCSFTEVTIGLCRLHEVLREHSSIHGATGREISGEAPQVLLATACGDQHVFGVVMVAEFFRRAGWRVWSEPGALCHQLATLLGQVHFDLLGLSAHCSTLADDIASEIETLREASCNARLRILVGGRLFLDEPDLVSRVGADGCAHDASSAPLVASELLAGSGALSY